MRRMLAVLFTVLLLLGSTPLGGQDCSGCGPVEPDTGGCRTCDAFAGVAYCGDTAEWGEASSWVCVGGQICYNTPNGPPYCEPNCGRRCYSI